MRLASLDLAKYFDVDVSISLMTGHQVAVRTIIEGIANSDWLRQWCARRCPRWGNRRFQERVSWFDDSWDVWYEPGEHCWIPAAEIRRRVGLGYPIVNQCHGLGYRNTLLDLISAMVLYPPQHGDLLLCPSTSAQVAVTKLLTETSRLLSRPCDIECVVLPLGVTPISETPKDVARDLLRLSRTEKIVLFIGRLSPSDKMDLIGLLGAFARVVRQQPSEHRYRLLLVGATPDPTVTVSVRDAAIALGIGAQVTCWCNVDNALRDLAYAAADVFVSLSHAISESFGLTIIEAMSARLPIIATNWDGYRDLVESGRTGMLVDTQMLTSDLDWVGRDAGFVNAWSSRVLIDYDQVEVAMLTLLSNEALRNEMASNAQRRAREFSPDRYTNRLHQLLSSRVQVAGAATVSAERGWSPDALQDTFASYASSVLDKDEKIHVVLRDTDIIGPILESWDPAAVVSSAAVIHAVEDGRHSTAITESVRRLLKAGILRIDAGDHGSVLSKQ